MSVTLMAIEAEVASRLGPFETHASTASSTQTLFVAADLASTALPGDKQGLYLLRRGLKSDGTAVGGFVATDRQRLVKEYDPDGSGTSGVAGSLLVDAPWQNQPVANEVCELHALDPARQVRPAVQKGLERCYVHDRVQVVLSGFAAERDITAALPWLTHPQQVYGAYYAPAGTIYGPRPIPWFEPFEQGGHVYLGSSPDPYPSTFLLRVLRPAASLVNNLSAPPSVVATDVPGGGSLAYAATYWAAVGAIGPYGSSPASVPVPVLPAQDSLNTHAIRLKVVQVPGAASYPVFLSVDAAPKLVATISEAQRAAGCTITAVSTVSATTPGPSTVDVLVPGNGAAAVQAAGPVNDADVLNVDLAYAAAAACATAWRDASIRAVLVPLAKSGLGVTQEVANAEFSRQALLHVKQPPDRVAFNFPFGPTTAADSPWAGVFD